MENASKALIMAGGVLIGILILSLMTTLFINARTVSKQHEEIKNSEAIQQFNVNFIKYLGQDLSIHDVVTITNFCNIEDNKVNNVTPTKDGTVEKIDKTQITTDIIDANNYYTNNYSNQNVKVEVVYKMEIKEYNQGYVSKIKFSNRKIKIMFYNERGTIVKTEYKSI